MHSTTVQGCIERSEIDDEGREGTRVSEMWGFCSLIMPVCGFNKFYVEAAQKLRCGNGGNFMRRNRKKSCITFTA